MPGLGPDEQVRRGLPGQALLRWLRVRRRGREAGHRARQAGLRRRPRQRPAARRRAGQQRRLLRAARAGGHDPRPGSRPRRPPHPRDGEELLGPPLRRRRLPRAPGGLASSTWTRWRALAQRAPAQDDPRRAGRPIHAIWTSRCSARSPTRSAPTCSPTWPTSPGSSPPACTPTRCPTRDVVTTHGPQDARRRARRDDHQQREELAKKLNSAIFPGQQGGPLEHVIAGKAVALRIAQTEAFSERQQRTLAGARAVADELLEAGHGVNVLTAGTDVHLIAGRPARVRARRAAGRGPSGRHRHHRQPQRRPVRPAPADGLERPARRPPRRSPRAASSPTTSTRSGRSSPPPWGPVRGPSARAGRARGRDRRAPPALFAAGRPGSRLIQISARDRAPPA